jgi:trehalose-phosphatase
MTVNIDTFFPRFTHRMKGKPLFFLADFDGTLVPIRRDPAKVVLSLRVRRLLTALSQQMPVAIISGRPLTFLEKAIAIPKIILAGNHGLEINMWGKKFRHPQAVVGAKQIRSLARRLQQAGEIQGVLIEDKGFTLTFHYRRVVPGLRQAACEKFYEIFKSFSNGNLLRVNEGKMCLEVTPNIDWGKESAILWILDVYLQSHPEKSVLPVFIGDDETDRAAIALTKKIGISFFRGDRTSQIHATYFVPTHEGMIRLLKCLAALPTDDTASIRCS